MLTLDQLLDQMVSLGVFAMLLTVRKIEHHLMAPQKLLNLVERARGLFWVALLVVFGRFRRRRRLRRIGSRFVADICRTA